jgi:hypothetical protein
MFRKKNICYNEGEAAGQNPARIGKIRGQSSKKGRRHDIY